MVEAYRLVSIRLVKDTELFELFLANVENFVSFSNVNFVQTKRSVNKISGYKPKLSPFIRA